MKIKFLLFMVFPMALFAVAQGPSNPNVIYVSSGPSGACVSSPPVYIVKSTGTIYTCNNGTWAAQTGGGGSGPTIAAGTSVTISEGSPCSTGTCTINATGGGGGIGGTVSSPNVPYASGADTLSDSAFQYDATGAVCDEGPCIYATDGASRIIQIQPHSIYQADTSGDTAIRNGSSTKITDSSSNNVNLTALSLYLQAGADNSNGTYAPTDLNQNDDTANSSLSLSTGSGLIQDSGSDVSYTNLSSNSLTIGGSIDGQAAIGVAAHAGTPNGILLPTTTASPGAVLTSDGGNPQQLSWTSGGGSGPVQTCDASTMSNYVPGVCIGTLDTAQILAFDGTSGTAVNVITAPGAGKLVTISQASAQYVFNSQPFPGSCQVDVEVNSNQFQATALLQPDCTQTTDQYTVQSGWGLASSAPASSLSNQALGLYLDSVVNGGSIATSSISVGDSGVGYIAADTWVVSAGNGDAIGTVLTATSYPITIASQGLQTLTISGDESASFVNGSPVVVTGSTCNDGDYTTASSLFGAGVTVITLDSGPACDTADGNIAGGVLTYSLTPGTGYAVASNQNTNAAGSQPTSGAGLQIDINSITGQGDGSLLYAIYFTVLPIT